MGPWNNPRAFHSPGEENVAAGGHHQHRARQQLARSQRRRCRQTTSEWQGRDQAKNLQGDQQEGGTSIGSGVYRFRSRAPSTSARCNVEGSLGLSRVSALTEDGKVMEMLARSGSYLVQQEPARCWVRDCTGVACLAAGHPSRTHLLQYHLIGEEDCLTSLIREEFLSMDEGNDGSIVESGPTSFQAGVTHKDAPRSFAEEYSLAPLNKQKKYSAQSFDQQVENYFKQL